MVTTRPPKTIVKPTALGPVANTDTKLLIYGLFQKGRVLAQDEVERRNHKQLSLRLRRSGLDVTKTMESFDFRFNASINRQEIYDLATCRYVERAEGIWLVGPAGVGKSHMAQALGHEAVRRGYDVLFLKTSRMLNHLNGGRADSSYEKRLLTYLRPDVLILDDFGLKPMRPPAAEDLYERTVPKGRHDSDNEPGL